jgi:hypothetical protein
MALRYFACGWYTLKNGKRVLEREIVVVSGHAKSAKRKAKSAPYAGMGEPDYCKLVSTSYAARRFGKWLP